MFEVNDVVAKALSVVRLRVNTIASNIANAETTRTADGGPYKRRDVVQVAQTSQGSFASTLDEASLAQPAIAAVVEDQSDPKKVYQPGHPDADKDGYVSYPNVNVVQAMTDLMSASRLYEANVSVLKSTQALGRTARDIGAGG
jgi:flagellar basal-body rod protein FlgC